MSEEVWDQARYNIEVAKVTAQIYALPAGALTTEILQGMISHFPTVHQTPVFALVMSGYQAHMLTARQQQIDYMLAEEEQSMARERAKVATSTEIRTFWTGLALLITALFASAYLPMTNAMTSLIVRLMAGIGSGLLIAFLPGLFSINSSVTARWVNVSFKATGGLAAIVMVYLFDPGTFSDLLKKLHH